MAVCEEERSPLGTDVSPRGHRPSALQPIPVGPQGAKEQFKSSGKKQTRQFDVIASPT